MPNEQTTPTAATIPTPTPAAASPGPRLYEDCVALVDSLTSEKDPANLSAGLKKLRGFFTDRIGKRQAATEKDGGAAVKTAISNARGFKPFEAKATPGATNATDSPWK